MNQKQLYVSAIIPVYNGEQFLAKAIASILEQNYDPLEIIVVDDGSTDNTAAVVQQFESKIRYFHQSNQGPAAARNLGLQQAQGNAIAFLDVDDLWSKSKLTLQTSCLLDNPRVGIVQGYTQLRRQVKDPHDQEAYINHRAPFYLSSLTSALYRRSVFEQVGLFNEKLIYGEDTDWFLRAWSQRIEQILLDEITLYYHKHDRNMTLGKDRVQLGLVRVYHQHLQRCRQNKQQNNPETPANFPPISEYMGRDANELIKNYNITIIANDRWGEMMYKYLGLMCQTPLIGTQILPTCYLKLLKNLRSYLESPLVFVEQSRYKLVNQAKQKQNFLIGVLKDEVEIQFPTAQDPSEVLANWNKRVTRINWDNLFIVYHDRHRTSPEESIKFVAEFEKLKFPYQVGFYHQEYPEFNSAIFLPQAISYDAKIWRNYSQYFDVIAWFNQKQGTNTHAYQVNQNISS